MSKKNSTSAWKPKKQIKKTSIGRGRGTRYKAKASNGTVPKGYRKRYRGQGR